MCQPEYGKFTDIALYFYIQYHLHLQLLAATQYAREQGVALKRRYPYRYQPE